MWSFLKLKIQRKIRQQNDFMETHSVWRPTQASHWLMSCNADPFWAHLYLCSSGWVPKCKSKHVAPLTIGKSQGTGSSLLVFFIFNYFFFLRHSCRKQGCLQAVTIQTQRNQHGGKKFAKNHSPSRALPVASETMLRCTGTKHHKAAQIRYSQYQVFSRLYWKMGMERSPLM